MKEIKVTHTNLYDDEKWYISVEETKTYHAHEIDKVMSDYTYMSFEKLSSNFGAYVQDDLDYEDIFFNDEKDCVKCKNFLEDLFGGDN